MLTERSWWNADVIKAAVAAGDVALLTHMHKGNEWSFNAGLYAVALESGHPKLAMWLLRHDTPVNGADTAVAITHGNAELQDALLKRCAPYSAFLCWCCAMMS